MLQRLSWKLSSDDFQCFVLAGCFCYFPAARQRDLHHIIMGHNHNADLMADHKAHKRQTTRLVREMSWVSSLHALW